MANPPVEMLEVPTPSGLREIRVSNPDKIYFSARKETKLDLVRYFLAVADGIVRGLYERPTVLKRHPEGAQGEAIYQKRVPDSRPPWLQTVTVTFPSGRHAVELCPVDVAHVAWAANLGTLDFHPWPTRRAHVEVPDEMRIDLDPQPGCGWPQVLAVAAVVREVLAEAGLVSWPKTSGNRGVHILVRLRPQWSFLQVRRSVLAIGREVERRVPDLATVAWWKEERGQRIFVDYNRMARDQTIASAYSVRARADATVSAPVTWAELADCVTEDFTIATMPARFAAVGDPHAGIDEAAGDLSAALEMVARDERDRGLGEAPYPPQFPKMEGEPMRVQPSRARKPPPAPSSP